MKCTDAIRDIRLTALILVLSLVSAATAGCPAATNRVYRIEPATGLKEVNDLVLAPGDTVLFRRGGVWRGQLRPRSG